MINRLVPACKGLAFCAKAKAAPGEISRVKFSDEIPQNNLVKSPKVDTFTASHQENVAPELQSEQLSGVVENNKSRENIKKGNA